MGDESGGGVGDDLVEGGFGVSVGGGIEVEGVFFDEPELWFRRGGGEEELVLDLM